MITNRGIWLPDKTFITQRLQEQAYYLLELQKRYVAGEVEQTLYEERLTSGFQQYFEFKMLDCATNGEQVLKKQCMEFMRNFKTCVILKEIQSMKI